MLLTEIYNIANLSLLVREVVDNNNLDIENYNGINKVFLGLVTFNRLNTLNHTQIKIIYDLGKLLHKSKPWIAFAAMMENWDYVHIVNVLAANKTDISSIRKHQ